MPSSIKEEPKSGGVLNVDPQEESFSTVGDVEMKRIWRKLDIHLLPLVTLLYLLSFLWVTNICALSPAPTCLLEIRRDRSNIGSLLLLTREARFIIFLLNRKCEDSRDVDGSSPHRFTIQYRGCSLLCESLISGSLWGQRDVWPSDNILLGRGAFVRFHLTVWPWR